MTFLISPRHMLAFGPTPVAISLTRSSWGDVRIGWAVSGLEKPSTRYRVSVIDTSTGNSVWETTTANHYAYFDIGTSLPLFGFPPTYLRVIIGGTTGVGVATREGDIMLDNSFVQKAIVLAGQSNAVGHFTSLSGASQDKVSASDLRNQLAASYGLAPAEVMPVNCAFGSAAADRFADDDPTNGANYWYDLDAGADGPRLTQFFATVAPIKGKVAAIVWAQGENDASAYNGVAPRHSDETRYTNSTTAIFNRMRTLVPAAQAPIVLQTLGRSYWGTGDAPEADGVTWEKYRNVQRAIAAARDDTIIGSWVRGAERISGYVPEAGSPGWIHYTSAVYHTAAADLAETIFKGLDRTNAAPLWVDMAAPGVGNAKKIGDGDIVMSWPAGSYSKWKWQNLSVSDGSVLKTVLSDAPSQTFTLAEQTAAYGFGAGTVVFDVAGYDAATDALSPTIRNTLSVASNIDAPVNLSATHSSFGDIRALWQDAHDSDVSGDSYLVEIYSTDAKTVLRSVVVTGLTFFDYTIELSAKDFGFIPTNLVFRVTRCGVQGQPLSGPSALFSGNPTLDNSFVKKLIVFAGDSNSAAHFMNLSGATPDQWSATTFRQRYATNFGLRPAEVLPLLAAWGSATIDKAAADNYPKNPTNYYWDVDANSAGPRATQLVAAVQATGLTPAGLVWIQDTDIQGFDEPSITPMPTVTRFYSGLTSTFNYFRAQLGTANLPIYISPTAGAYVGNPPLPYGVGAFDQLRAAEALISSAQSGKTYFSMDLPATSVDDFIPEAAPNQDNYEHYKAATYQRVATTMADAMYNGTNLAAAGQKYDPATLPVSPIVTAVVQDGDGNIHIQYKDALARNLSNVSYTVSIMDTDEGKEDTVIRALGSFTGTEAIYTAAQNVADYGFTPSYLGVRIAQVLGGKTGVNYDWNGAVGAAGAAPTGLAAAKQPNNDILYTWTATAGVQYRVTSYSVNNNAPLHQWFVTGVGQQVYAAADIVKDYGFDTANYYFGVSIVDPNTGIVGKAATKSGAAVSWATKPTNLTATHKAAGGDITISWTGDVTKQWQLKINKGTTTTVIRTVTAAANSFVYTQAMQTTDQGAAINTIRFSVAQYDAATGATGSAGTFNAAVTTA